MRKREWSVARAVVLALISIPLVSAVCLAQAAYAASAAAPTPVPPPLWMFVDLHAHPDTGPVSQEFLFDFLCPCMPTSATYNFGDGTPPVTTPAQTTHTYAAPGTYTASVTVTGLTPGGWAQGSDTVVVTVLPDFFFVTATATPDTGPAPLTVAFTSNLLGGKKPFTYAWDFGDGQTSGEANPTHAYGRRGSYKVSLTVTDSRGWSAGATTSVFVAMAAIGVSTAATPTEGFAPLGVFYSASASGGTPPFTFSWRFSDGSTATGATASVTYTAPGTYTAGLTVSDSAGNWTVTGAPSVNVYPKMPPPPMP